MMKALKFTSSFVIPVGVLIAAICLSGLDARPSAAMSIVCAFMVLKLLVQHFKFEPGRAIFAGAGREALFHVHMALVYSLMALATFQIFVLATS